MSTKPKNTPDYVNKNWKGETGIMKDVDHRIAYIEAVEGGHVGHLVNTTYKNHKCGCEIYGNGSLPFPMEIGFCQLHNSAIQLLEALKAVKNRRIAWPKNVENLVNNALSIANNHNSAPDLVAEYERIKKLNDELKTINAELLNVVKTVSKWNGAINTLGTLFELADNAIHKAEKLKEAQ